MRKAFLGVACALVAATTAPAHFVFIVPDKTGSSALVILSEDLKADEDVAVGKLAGLKLTARDAGGKDTPVELLAAEHALTANLPGAGPRVVFGSVPYGVMQKGEGKPYLLAYHPKALVGGVAADKAVVGDKVPAELVPVAEADGVRFKLVAGGKAVGGAEVTVLKPDGSRAKVKTGDDGLTEPVAGSGRFGAWVRYTEARAGDHAGKSFTKVRHYATLVADVGGR